MYDLAQLQVRELFADDVRNVEGLIYAQRSRVDQRGSGAGYSLDAAVGDIGDDWSILWLDEDRRWGHVLMQACCVDLLRSENPAGTVAGGVVVVGL